MHLHKWSPWIQGTATHSSPLFPKLGTWETQVQVRKCTDPKCQKMQVKEL